MRSSQWIRLVLCMSLFASMGGAGCQGAARDATADGTDAAESSSATKYDLDLEVRVNLLDKTSRSAAVELRMNVSAYLHEYIHPFFWDQLFSKQRVGYVLLDPTDAIRDSRDLADVKVRIRRFDEVVRRAIAAGGRVLFIFNSMMPRWLSVDPKNEGRLFSGPSQDRIWPSVRPKNQQKWAEVMKAFVHHFNRELETGGRVSYVIGNEPDNYWVGTEDEFFEFYRTSVRGALAADRNVRIGGITPSNAGANRFTKAKPKGRSAQFEGLDTAGKRPMIENWIRFCRQNDLPIHLVTWHDYPMPSPVPIDTSNVRVIPSLIGEWLREHGYSDVELLITDWPDWKSVPVRNDGAFMASYVATVVIATAGTGAVSLVYNGLRDLRAYLDADLARANAGFGGGIGLITNAGVPKPAFNVYRLISTMTGDLVRVDTGDEFVHALASVTPDRIYVLLTNFVPSDRSLRSGPGLARGLSKEELDGVRHYMESLPSVEKFRAGVLSGAVRVAALPLPKQYKVRLERYQKMVLELPKRRSRAVRTTLRIHGFPAGSWSYSEYIVNDHRANSYARRSELQGPLEKALATKDPKAVFRVVRDFNARCDIESGRTSKKKIHASGAIATISTTLNPYGVHLVVVERER